MFSSYLVEGNEIWSCSLARLTPSDLIVELFGTTRMNDQGEISQSTLWHDQTSARPCVVYTILKQV
jgi:hypothetical protein